MKPLTTKQVIERLEKLSKRWPKHLMLFSNAGVLELVNVDDSEILHSFYKILNSGGDCGSYEKDGKEYLNDDFK